MGTDPGGIDVRSGTKLIEVSSIFFDDIHPFVEY